MPSSYLVFSNCQVLFEARHRTKLFNHNTMRYILLTLPLLFRILRTYYKSNKNNLIKNNMDLEITQTLDLLLNSCVTFNNFLSLSETQFSHLWNRDDLIYLIVLMWA